MLTWIDQLKPRNRVPVLDNPGLSPTERRRFLRNVADERFWAGVVSTDPYPEEVVEEEESGDDEYFPNPMQLDHNRDRFAKVDKPNKSQSAADRPREDSSQEMDQDEPAVVDNPHDSPEVSF
jgi:hypothetical protein